MSRRDNNNNNSNKFKDEHDFDVPSLPGSTASLPTPRRTSTDDPSQLTDGGYDSMANNSTQSAFSMDHIRSIVHQASEILVGRLPSSTTVEDDRPRLVTVPSARSDDFHDATEHAVADDDQPIDFLHDKPSEMTWSRRIALSLLDKHWYNPSLKTNARIQREEESEQRNDDESSNAFADTSNHSAPTALRGRAQDAYPFTVSKREQPSLAKAWACKYTLLFIIITIIIVAVEPCVLMFSAIASSSLFYLGPLDFEHVSLPRFIVRPKPNARRKNCLHRAFRRVFCKGKQQFERAEPGERDLATKLYSPLFTPHNQLGDWGLGIG